MQVRAFERYTPVIIFHVRFARIAHIFPKYRIIH